MNNKYSENTRRISLRISDKELDWIKNHYKLDTIQKVFNKMIQETIERYEEKIE